MSIAILTLDGFLFLLRWLHLFFGVIWIGHLYYFNFVQGAFLGEVDASTKSNVVQKLLPRALAWFRWGAMFTWLTGILYLGLRGHRDSFEVFTTSWGLCILLGSTLGTLMWANVWFIIWPKQKIVIQSAIQVAQGGAALPQAAASALRAGVASRTNALFSIPMLFFMGAASHLPLSIDPQASWTGLIAGVVVLLGALEWNAIRGKTGPMTSISGVISCGFLLTAFMYVLLETLI